MGRSLRRQPQTGPEDRHVSHPEGEAICHLEHNKTRPRKNMVGRRAGRRPADELPAPGAFYSIHNRNAPGIDEELQTGA